MSIEKRLHTVNTEGKACLLPGQYKQELWLLLAVRFRLARPSSEPGILRLGPEQ